MRRSLIITLLIMLTCNVLAATRSREAVVDSLKKALTTAPTADDSIRILYGIYDMSYISGRQEAAEQLYKTAVKMGRTAVRLDALRLLTNIATRNDSLQEIQQRRASLVSASPDQKETVVFIKVMRASTAAHTLSGDDLRNKLHLVLQGYKYDQQVDLYRRIELLFTICKYLESNSSSDLLFRYYKELEGLIKKLPRKPGALRSAYYTAAALANTEAGRHAQAIEDDREVLKIISELEERHNEEGREWCNYDNNYYVAYRRMLSNYEALGSNELEELYGKIGELRRRNPDIAADIETSGHLVDIYYHMARHEYAAALHYLQIALPKQTSKSRRRTLLQMAITAAQNCGDNAALLRAYKEYIPIAEKMATESGDYRMLEYQVLYDVNTVTASNSDLEAQYARAEAAQHKRMLQIGAFVLTVLALILLLLFLAYRRSKRLTHNIADANQMLTTERDNLRRIQKELIVARDKAKSAEQHKTDFINTISHEVSEPVNAIVGYSQLIVDSVDDKRRATLEQFIQIIQLNAQLLSTLVNDVLDVSELENSRIVIKLKNVSLKEICEFTADSIRTRLQPGVELRVTPLYPGQDNCNVDTDALRAEQVIVNLLSNAVKFTDKGHIDVLYGIEKEQGIAKIIVEDTGPGIPKGKERKIFERFYKCSQVSQGIGLGLPICRLVSRLLGGSVELDATYTEGARFVFTLPLHKPDKTAHTVQI
jgi:signal transduction histidine kinase